MAFKPILFSTPMVQALLAGRKTQTRRLVKSRYESGLFMVGRRKLDGQISEITSLDWDERPMNDTTNDIYPKYEVGDILWVREAYYAYGWWIEEGLTNTGKPKKRFVDFTVLDTDGYQYREEGIEIVKDKPTKVMGWYKRSSLFMPREAARIFLKVTNVRVELLQDISEADAVAEGIEVSNIRTFPDYKDYTIKEVAPFHEKFHFLNPILSFQSLWQSINGPESWDNNPYVFVYEFEQVEKPDNF